MEKGKRRKEGEEKRKGGKKGKERKGPERKLGVDCRWWKTDDTCRGEDQAEASRMKKNPENDPVRKKEKDKLKNKERVKQYKKVPTGNTN